MAQLANKPCPGDWSFDGNDLLNDPKNHWTTRHDEKLKALQEVSDKVDPNVSLVGALVSFPCGDGKAIYRVSKDKPLTLQHVPCLDAWQVPYSQIRGLRRADIVQQVESARRIRKLFRAEGSFLRDV